MALTVIEILGEFFLISLANFKIMNKLLEVI